MANNQVAIGPPATAEDREKIKCTHHMVPLADVPKEKWGDKKKGFIMHCKFPLGAPDGKDLLKITRRFMFMGTVCTECMLNDVQNLFKNVDKHLREERDLQHKKSK